MTAKRAPLASLTNRPDATMPPKGAGGSALRALSACAAHSRMQMLRAKRRNEAAMERLREAAGAEAWDGQADESAYFDYDIDDDLPDWRDARK